MDDGIPQLPRSVAALQRLERALQRLEQVAAKPNGDLFPPAPAEMPKDDRFERLEQAASQVETRLDAVIGRLSRYLAE